MAPGETRICGRGWEGYAGRFLTRCALFGAIFPALLASGDLAFDPFHRAPYLPLVLVGAGACSVLPALVAAAAAAFPGRGAWVRGALAAGLAVALETGAISGESPARWLAAIFLAAGAGCVMAEQLAGRFSIRVQRRPAVAGRPTLMGRGHRLKPALRRAAGRLVVLPWVLAWVLCIHGPFWTTPALQWDDLGLFLGYLAGGIVGVGAGLLSAAGAAITTRPGTWLVGAGAAAGLLRWIGYASPPLAWTPAVLLVGVGIGLEWIDRRWDVRLQIGAAPAE